MLASEGAGSRPAPDPDLSICDVILPDPVSYDAIEMAVRMMHLNTLSWQARCQPRVSLA